MFHVEFGHFSSLDHFKLFEKYAVKNADSLGMNEQEI
jgi:ADP-dependent phosphofructokinase/glucokinase